MVRGTSNVVDAMQDLSYYSIASSLKVVLQFVLPIQHILPPEFIQELIQAMLNRAFAPIEYNELLREVKHVTGGRRSPRTSQDAPGGQTMIVGHSLGGAYVKSLLYMLVVTRCVLLYIQTGVTLKVELIRACICF